VITVAGGKLTTYRSMAAEVVDLVQRALGQKRENSRTDSVELPGGDRPKRIAALQATDESLARPLVESLPYTGAHLDYAVQSEMAQTLSDLLIRRTHLAFETRDHGLSVAARAAEIVGPLLSWTEATKAACIREYREDVRHVFAIS